ncbi:MAG: rhodanese-like domain-containing protein [Bacteroidota bacterium]|nr:rhodanese-like domain-containing protein [Bacteroidota bacterium]
MRSISAILLKEMIDKKAPIQIIDMREPEQYARYHITNADNIPLDIIKKQIDFIRPNHLVVVYCTFGSKSEYMADYLREIFKTRNICFLEGGLYEWYKEIDPGASIF